MEIFLKKRRIIYMIKKYYRNNYGVVFCDVDLQAENILDKLKEVDLFRREGMNYNILFRAKVTGFVNDSEGFYSNFEQTLNEKRVKDIIINSLREDYDVTDVKLGYKIVNNTNGPGMQVEFQRARVNIEEKPQYTLKLPKPNVKNK